MYAELEAYGGGLVSKEMQRIHKVTDRIEMTIFDQRLSLRVAHDMKHTDNGRIFVQVYWGQWKGRKWYLSEHMTDDEIMKTAYAAYDSFIRHEAMEGFKVDGKVLFNPHVDFEQLLLITDKIITRDGREEARNNPTGTD